GSGRAGRGRERKRRHQGQPRRPHPRLAGALLAALVGDVISVRGVAHVLVFIALIAAGAASPARAEDAEIAKRRAADQTTFTDAQIFEGFFKIAFGAELRLA